MGTVGVGERAGVKTTARRGRWSRRPFLAACVRLLVVTTPLLTGWVAAVAFESWVTHPPWAPNWSWALIAIALATVAAVVTGRVARRALPLAALLQVSLVFPDRAPSRVLTARRSGSVRTLERMLTDPAPPPDATTAAVRALTLVGALGRHDRLTRGHCERVRSYAELMARQLDLSNEDAERLRWVALLHDIGKIHVPAAVLNKPGKLDEDEWDAIRQHPGDGARLIAGLEDWLGPWAPSIGQHHERFDGGGYPAGLSGEEICLGARVIAVVDAFDVMTASRSYKRPVSSAAARRELERCAGKQFDPDIVQSFVALSEPRGSWIAGMVAGLSRTLRLGRTGTQSSAASGGTSVPAITATTLARTAAAVGAMTLAVAGTPLTAAATPSSMPASLRHGSSTTSGVAGGGSKTSAARPGSSVRSSGSGRPSAAPGPASAPAGTSGSTASTPPSTAPNQGAAHPGSPSSPAIELPPVTIPSVGVPSVTVLGVTLRAVTLPAVGVPAVTVPPVTVPPVTIPPVVRNLLDPRH